MKMRMRDIYERYIRIKRERVREGEEMGERNIEI